MDGTIVDVLDVEVQERTCFSKKMEPPTEVKDIILKTML